MTRLALFWVFILLISSCKKDEPEIPIPNPPEPEESGFSVDGHYILKDGERFEVKGVVYVPGYPGSVPWDLERSTSLSIDLQTSIQQDLEDIKAMGANTVRFWGAPQYCYEALDRVGGLNFIQTIWIQVDEPDLQEVSFKQETKSYIEEVIDRIYASFDGKSPPLVAWTIGNELSEASILSTNAAHPDIKSFSGRYIVTDTNVTATEAFLAEMADYARRYEFDTYGRKSLISYSNEIRTADIIDVPFLDFICHNAYSYAVPTYRPGTAAGSSTGTLFQGWIEEIKAKHPDQPLLITETGLSVSPNATHVGPPNYGYGGNTEAEQRTGLLQNIEDIETAQLPIAGVVIHEYLDAWWKFSVQDSYTQDPNDIEEWFGLARLKEEGEWYQTEFRPSYLGIREHWK